MVKLIVSDLDGTLLRSDQTISKRSLEVFRKCRLAGIRLALATAQPPRLTRELLPKELALGAIINYNGALVFENGAVVHEKTLSEEVIGAVLRMVRDKIAQPKVCFEIEDRHYSNFDVQEVFGPIDYQPIDLNDFRPTTAHKIILCNMKGEKDREILACLETHCCCMVTDDDQLYQIMAKDVSKFNAIQCLLDRHGIGPDEVMCFGDDRNDLEMISHCGIGVAMENATQELKKKAKYVTKSNDHDGVALFVEQYLDLK
jgi:Cof subfamily protein (haloacid dehalogenase superfamily)